MDMKKKIILIFVLLFLLLNFLFIYNNKNKEEFFKILNVIEADKFDIDLNRNNIIDKNEHFKLRDIIAFSPIRNEFTKNHAKELGLEINDYLKLGLIARKFAQDNYLNKDVAFFDEIEKYDENKDYRQASIKYQNIDIAQNLLESGLAVLDKNSKNIKLLKSQNISQINENKNELNKLEYLIVNLKNNIAHNLDCKYGQKNKKCAINSKKSNQKPFSLQFLQ